MPLLNPNFFYDHSVSHYGHKHFLFRNLWNFLKIQVILVGVSRKQCDSAFFNGQGRFPKTYLGVPKEKIWYIYIFFFKTFKKSFLLYKPFILKLFYGKLFFFQIFFSDFFFRFFPLVPQGRFLGLTEKTILGYQRKKFDFFFQNFQKIISII